MIVFVGSETRGSWIKEYAGKQEYGYARVEESTRIGLQVNDILSYPCKYMIFDIEQYVDDGEVIADQIDKIAKMNNAKIIIYAPGYVPTSSVMIPLIRNQIKNFITGTVLSEQKDALGKSLNGYFDTYHEEEFGFVEADLEEDDIKKSHNFQNIGIAGANSRMGTTTQAIQFVKYLTFKGYKAAYVEMNNHRWIRRLLDWYDVEHEEALGKVTYSSVDMFYDLSKLQSVLKLAYDYYIFDYGVYSDVDFNKISFLERDYQVFVCGSAPDEMENAMNIIHSSFYDEVYYLFNLVPLQDQKELLKGMEDKKERTFFSPYTPDLFAYNNSPIYEKMVPVESKVKEEKMKKGFFLKKRIEGKCSWVKRIGLKRD